MSITRKYSDLDAAFGANPSTGDLLLRTDAAAVKFAIKNLVLTMNYERPFDSSIGSVVKKLLFEPMGDMTNILIKKTVTDTISQHEPRAEVLTIDVIDRPDNNAIGINIIFRIRNTITPLNVSIVLDRTR